MENTIIEALFATKAVRVAPENQPFWYTSGRLGPFFINTHFLLENEAAAGEADYLQLKQWLKDAYEKKKSGGKLVSTLDVSARERYNYKNISHLLYEIMTDLKEKK